MTIKLILLLTILLIASVPYPTPEVPVPTPQPTPVTPDIHGDIPLQIFSGRNVISIIFIYLRDKIGMFLERR